MGEGCRSPFSLIRTPKSMEAHEHLVEGVFDPISDHERRPDGGESPHRDRFVWREEIDDDVIWEDQVPTLREGELIC